MLGSGNDDRPFVVHALMIAAAINLVIGAIWATAIGGSALGAPIIMVIILFGVEDMAQRSAR